MYISCFIYNPCYYTVGYNKKKIIMHKMVEQCTICQSSPVHAWRVNTTAINFYRLKTLSQLVTEIKEQQKEKTQTHVKSYFSMFFF